MAVTKKFTSLATSFAGCDGGNPHSPYWFCGIEYGGPPKGYENIPRDPPELTEGHRNNFLTESQYNTRLLKLMSAIAGRPVQNYKNYFAEFNCFAKDDFGFKLNLYPLAFRNKAPNLWSKENETDTGFADKQIYKAWCQANRFPVIRSWTERYRPNAIICTGSGELMDFLLAFNGLEKMADGLKRWELSAGARTRHLYGKPIIQGTSMMFVTPFLGPGGLLSDASIEECGALIKCELSK